MLLQVQVRANPASNTAKMDSSDNSTDSSRPTKPNWDTSDIGLMQFMILLKAWLYYRDPEFRTLNELGTVQSKEKTAFPTTDMVRARHQGTIRRYDFSDPSPVCVPISSF